MDNVLVTSKTCREKYIFNLNRSLSGYYIEENGVSSVEAMSVGTGISAKNINRFINIEGIIYPVEEFEDNVGNNGITLN